MLYGRVVFTAIELRKVIGSALLHHKIAQKRNRDTFVKTIIFRDAFARVLPRFVSATCINSSFDWFTGLPVSIMIG